MNTYTGEIKPCPFCGHIPISENLIDSLYPNGMEWFGEDLEYIHTNNNPTQLVLAKDMTERGKYYTFSCLESEGGCGCTFTGTSINDVMMKWNKRVSDEK